MQVQDLFAELNLDHRRLHVRVFKIKPGPRRPYFEPDDVVTFIDNFDQAEAEELKQTDKISKWFDPVPIHSEEVQIVILHDLGTSTPYIQGYSHPTKFHRGQLREPTRLFSRRWTKS